MRTELAQESQNWLEKSLGWGEALLSVWRKRVASYTHTVVFCSCCFSILCFFLLEGGRLLSSSFALQQPHVSRGTSTGHSLMVLCFLHSYRCDDFVVNDTKLGLVQKVREHLQNLEK